MTRPSSLSLPFTTQSKIKEPACQPSSPSWLAIHAPMLSPFVPNRRRGSLSHGLDPIRREHQGEQ